MPLGEADLACRVAKPSSRQLLAGRAGGKAAAALSGVGRQGFLAIAHDGGDAGIADQGQGDARVGTIGDYVARADHLLERNPQRHGGRKQRLGGL